MSTGVSRSRQDRPRLGLGLPRPRGGGSHGARPTGSFSALATLTAVPRDQPDPGPQEGAWRSREPPLPHTCQALVPGAPPSQPASLLVYELVLTAAVTVLGSVGPASTVVT